MRLSLALVPLFALAACGGADGNNSAAPVASGSPVAAVSPPAGKAWTDVVERTPEGYRMGNPNAPIKLVEYGSRTCPACAAFATTAMEPLKSEFIATGKVSFEYRDFLRNGADLAASVLGRCGGTERFFPMLEQMFAGQSATMTRLQALPESFYQQLGDTPVTGQAGAFAQAAGYIDFVKQRGVTEQQARACLADTALTQSLANVTDTAMRDKNISGTPSFLLNDRVLEGQTSWEQIREALRAAGA